ncbi:hypothetical protein [Nocardia wallacei]|uniref:nucleotide-binding protein n=1 Tax=Nocardia wallacei TaxID=480035 RepID=UPI00245701FA|nr:hypothetical protein [Nocardia wallacei]
MRAVGGIVLGIAKTKGGMAGSTLAHNLAHEYAQRGCRVLLLDTDTIQPLIEAAIHRPEPPILTLMPYPHASIWEDLGRLRAGQDVVVIDGQGHNRLLTRAVIAAAGTDEHGVVVVPVSLTVADVRAAKRDMVPLLKEAEDERLVPWKMRVRVVRTRFKDSEREPAAAAEALAEDPVIAPDTATDMPHRAIYTSTLGSGLAVCEMAPGSAAALEIAALATELAELALSDPEVSDPETKGPNQ